MERYYKIDRDAWYDTEERVLWRIDDPIAEREDAWNRWQIFDDHGTLMHEYWWWGVWMPSWRHLHCSNDGFDGLELVEEGRTIRVDVHELRDLINENSPSTYYIYHQQDGTRVSHLLNLGGHFVPDLTSPRWDYFTPPPSFFRTRRAVSNRDDRSPTAVHRLRNRGLR